MTESNNLFLFYLKSAIKCFVNFISVKKVERYEITDKMSGEMIEFYSNYNFLAYSINILYSKDFFKKDSINLLVVLKKYEFSWIRDKEKYNTVHFIFTNLLKIIEGNVFYAKFSKNILKYPANQLSAKLLRNNRNLKILQPQELANFLMLLIYEPMVEYVKFQNENFKESFANYKSEDIIKIFYHLDYFSRKIVPYICNNKPQYTSSVDNNCYIKVSSLRISDRDVKDLYNGLRENILMVFQKPKDVNFNISNQSPLTNAMFRDKNINFEDFIKLIIKNDNWSGFVKNIKNKNSKYMALKYWQVKIMSNIGNIILMNLRKNEVYK